MGEATGHTVVLEAKEERAAVDAAAEARRACAAKKAVAREEPAAEARDGGIAMAASGRHVSTGVSPNDSLWLEILLLVQYTAHKKIHDTRHIHQYMYYYYTSTSTILFPTGVSSKCRFARDAAHTGTHTCPPARLRGSRRSIGPELTLPGIAAAPGGVGGRGSPLTR